MGAIGRTGQSAAYGQDADKEDEQAEKWRDRAISFGVAAGFALLISLAFRPLAAWLDNEALDSISDWQGVLGRLAFAAALGGLSAYAARQATMHRRAARRARNRELALASLGAYLEPLGSTRQEQVIEAFAFIFFTPTDDGNDKDGDSSPALGPQILNLLRELEPD